MAVRGAKLLEPVFERTEGRRGRLSIQVDPARYRDTEAMLEQAIAVPPARPEHPGEAPGHGRGTGGDRGGDGERHPGQRHRQHDGRRRPRGRRGHRARARPPLGIRPRHRRHPSRLHADDRPAGGLAEGRLRPRWRPDVAGPGRMGRHRRLQARLRDLSRARLPDAAPVGRVPQPPPLVAADRRRHRHHDPAGLAAPAEPVGHRGPDRASTSRSMARSSPSSRTPCPTSDSHTSQMA